MSVASVARAHTRALPKTGSPKSGYLRLVAARRSSASRTPFVVVVVLILAVGLLGLLALNTALAQDAFRLHALQAEGRALADREQALQRQVADLQSPHSLAARATSLGMVPGGPPAFLRLADGQVLGSAQPGATPLVIAPVAPPAATAAAKPKPKPKPKPASGGWQPVSKPAKPSSGATWTAPGRSTPAPSGGGR